MRPPRMTIRRWMATIGTSALLMWVISGLLHLEPMTRAMLVATLMVFGTPVFLIVAAGAWAERATLSESHQRRGRNLTPHRTPPVRQPWIAWLCAAPMPLLGVAAGLSLAMARWDRIVQAELARSPGEFVCGNGAVPLLFFGLIGGSLGGIVVGRAVAGLVTRMARKRGGQDAAGTLYSNNGASTADPIATESERNELRSLLDTVDSQIVLAEGGDDEDVTRKLNDYRATLKRKLQS